MPEYPPLETAPPQIWTADHIRAAEDGLRQLAVANHILKKCESCKIPVGEQRADCDGLCEFLGNFLAEAKGQQSQLPSALGG